MKPLKLSVNELIEFSARKGDYSVGGLGPTALEGIQGHQAIQRQRDDSWISEMPLRHTYHIDGIAVCLQGRADLAKLDATVILEELKTSYLPLSAVPAGRLELFWSQTQVYGALLGETLKARGHATEACELRLTLVQLPQNRPDTETRHCRFIDLNNLLQGYLQAYVTWWKAVLQHRQIRNQSATQLSYPFSDYRKGQYDLARHVYRSLSLRRPLAVEAPTGLGKTMAVLFPAIKLLAKKSAERILYLTSKTIGQQEPNKALAQLHGGGLSLKCLTLCAKERLCFCTTQQIRGPCSYQQGYYDRLPAARDYAFSQSSINQTQWLEIAELFHLCPFSLSLDLAAWFDVVIADVNYFYDPLVRLTNFHQHPQQDIVLLDEAHNLLQRSREMYSAELAEDTFDQLLTSLPKSARRMTKLASTTRRHLRQITETFESVQLFIPSLKLCLEALLEYSEQQPLDMFDSNPDLAQLIKAALRFITINELRGDAHRCLVEVHRDKVRVKLHCINATEYLLKAHKRVKRMIAFSATLRPIDYYKLSLGFASSADHLVLASPFPKENCLVLRCDFIDTRWQHRQRTLPELYRLVVEVINRKIGNYLVFFPSYGYLTQFAELIQGIDLAEFTVLTQKSEASHQQRQAFVASFQQQNTPTIGLAVLGGYYAEGIDYLGSSLIGCIIIGTGLAPPSKALNHQLQWHQKHQHNPYLFAQLYPSLCRVLQSAGRVIRSETDKGVIILVDKRYARPEYHNLLPEHWTIKACAQPSVVARHLMEFWR